MLIALSFLFGLGVILLAVAVLATQRQLRIARQSLFPVGRVPMNEGARDWEPAPIVSAPSISGATLTIGGTSRDPRLLLLLFVGTGSDLCDAAVRDAVELCSRAGMRLLLLGDGDGRDYADLMARNGLAADDIVLVAAASEDFQLGPVPSAALIDASGHLLARGTVQRREQLQALLAAIGPQAAGKVIKIAGSTRA